MNVSKAELFSETNVGLKRTNNEDEAGTMSRPGFDVVLVADGMGGHSSGEIASKLAKDSILASLSFEDKPKNLFHAKWMVKRIMKKANAMIHKLSSKKAECYGMGTTLVMGIVMEEITLIVNCGDSRAYSYSSSGGLKRLTTDQTVVEYLYKLGAMSKDEIETSPKRHVLMNALGIAPSVDYDLSIINSDYEVLLLCSDGLTNMVKDERIEELIAENKDKSAAELGKILINEALANGGVDNIAVSIMEASKK
jgi:serine/threonine protein phosphatase PrpC